MTVAEVSLLTDSDGTWSGEAFDSTHTRMASVSGKSPFYVLAALRAVIDPPGTPASMRRWPEHPGWES